MGEPKKKCGKGSFNVEHVTHVSHLAVWKRWFSRIREIWCEQCKSSLRDVFLQKSQNVSRDIFKTNVHASVQQYSWVPPPQHQCNLMIIVLHAYQSRDLQVGSISFLTALCNAMDVVAIGYFTAWSWAPKKENYCVALKWNFWIFGLVSWNLLFFFFKLYFYKAPKST